MKLFHLIIPPITVLIGILTVNPPLTTACLNEHNASPKPHDKNIRYVFGSLDRHAELIHQFIALGGQSKSDSFSEKRPKHPVDYDKFASLLSRQRLFLHEDRLFLRHSVFAL